ncbi:MAG: serpin family protein [Clostridia bacterium]|nr:serpin family protein [Clostridia bacterium]
MKKNELYEVVSNIEEGFVDHALETEEKNIRKADAKTKAPKRRLPLWGAVAAAVLVAATVITVSIAVTNRSGKAGMKNDGGSTIEKPTQGEIITEHSLTNLMEGIKANPAPSIRKVSKAEAETVADFAVKLLKNAKKNGENSLVSPISVIAALSMTANGAKGNTLSQMESTLGMSLEDLNSFFKAYVRSLAQDDKNKFSLADSIWFKSGCVDFNNGFLQANADFYGADAYEASFDEKTLADINKWVNDNTNGMIPKILDKVPDSAVMYLINALAFEAEWIDPYNEEQVFPSKFTLENGQKKDVTLMTSNERFYLETANATGFIKHYANHKYAFAALLPNEGVTVNELVSSLDGKTLSGILTNAEQTSVRAVIPKFEAEFGTDLADSLKAMGMTDAFDSPLADFSGIGTWKLDGFTRIGHVIHKTYISVTEQGTKAGAATAVEMKNDSIPINNKEVILNRPFVYMLIDLENNIPFFIGTLEDVAG